MKKTIVLIILAIVLVSCGWLQAGFSTNPMDFNNDKRVDTKDFAMFASNWLWSGVDPNEFAYIPAGSFEMGDHFAEAWEGELPVHTVTLDSFYMSKYEITNQQYCDYLNSAILAGDINDPDLTGGVVYAADDTSNSFPYCDTHSYNVDSQINYSAGVFSVNIKGGTMDMSNHPMIRVRWYGSIAYCNWKSQQEGLESCYNLSTWECDYSKDGYRLPTEAEWEYAARGGEHSPYYRYPWGDSIDGSMANYGSSGDPYETPPGTEDPWTTPVGYYDGNQTPTGVDMANGYGLYDVAGNVKEWCNDWRGDTYYQECNDIGTVTNPTGPASGIYRILRGGGWTYIGCGHNYCRVAARCSSYPDDERQYLYTVGFRVCVFASH